MPKPTNAEAPGPIEQAKAVFEDELNKNTTPEVVELKEKAQADQNYEPSEKEIKEGVLNESLPRLIDFEHSKKPLYEAYVIGEFAALFTRCKHGLRRLTPEEDNWLILAVVPEERCKLKNLSEITSKISKFESLKNLLAAVVKVKNEL